MVVAGLVVQVHPELLRCYCMPACDRLHQTEASLGFVDLNVTPMHPCAVFCYGATCPACHREASLERISDLLSNITARPASQKQADDGTGEMHLGALLQDVLQEGEMVPPQIPERFDISPAGNVSYQKTHQNDLAGSAACGADPESERQAGCRAIGGRRPIPLHHSNAVQGLSLTLILRRDTV